MRPHYFQLYGGVLSRLLRVHDIFIPAWLFLLIPNWERSPLSVEWLWIFVITIGIFSAVVLPFCGVYETFRQRSLSTLLIQLTLGWLLVLSALSLEAFATKLSTQLSRVDLGLWALAVWLVLVVTHVGGRKLLRLYRSRGGNSRFVLFWGNRDGAMRVFQELEANPYLGLRLLVWFCPHPSGQAPDLPDGMPPCAGGLNEMQQWLNTNRIDKIFFSHVSGDAVPIEELLKCFGDTCSPVHYIPEWAHPSMCFQVEQLGSAFCIGLWGKESVFMDLQIKRLSDILISFSLLALLSPLLLTIAALIKLTSPGPVLFLQDRYGIDGRPFKILKFRTMTVMERGDQPHLRQAMRNDPRVTPLGRFLRRWSLDELPQLFNVLSGSMSLVGPRPHAVEHNEFYRKRISGYMERHLCKPGITGLAQVDGWRGETADLKAMQTRVEDDLRYQREWSLMLDLEILLRTPISIFSHTAF